MKKSYQAELTSGAIGVFGLIFAVKGAAFHFDYLEKVSKFRNSLGSVFYTFSFPTELNWDMVFGCLLIGASFGVIVGFSIAKSKSKSKTETKTEVSNSGI